MAPKISLRARLYGWAVTLASALHYGLFPASPDERLNWLRQRLNPALPAAAAGPLVWIHAVSAGETKVAAALRTALLEQGVAVVLSATTGSGLARIRAIAGPDRAFLMPLDTLPAQRRLFDTLRPDAMVLVESEFWPAQFRAAAEAGVPVVVANAILSERSYARHRRFGAVARATILQAARIHAQDDTIARRFASLGVAAERLSVCGNLKLAPPPGARRAPARSGPRTVTFGNLHPAEPEVLAPVLAELRRRHPAVRLLLIPRQPAEFTAEVVAQRLGPELRFLTDAEDLQPADAYVWLNRMGTLAEAYRRSEIVVVGGTFDATGGHDLAEPLHLGAASLYGPNVTRQRELHRVLGEAGCALQVEDAAQLLAALEELLADPELNRQRQARFATLIDAAQAQVESIAAEIADLAKAHHRASGR